MKGHRRIALSGALLLIVLAFAGSTLAATTIVRPSAMDGWITQQSGTASVTFVSGPAGSNGAGSAQLAVGANGDDAAQLRSGNYAGLLLADITSLNYRTYVQQWVDGQVPYILLNVDLDGNGTTDDLLFFEPAYQDATFFPSNPQASVALNTWQTWDAANGGWWSLNGVAGAGPGSDVKSLDDYVAAEPNAALATGNSLRIVAGFGAGSWDNFIGNVDTLTINGDAYNFEPNLPTPPSKNACKGSGWTNYARPDGSTFKNQGDCIQYVNTGK